MPSAYLKQFHSDFLNEYKNLTFNYEHAVDLNESLYFILFKGGFRIYCVMLIEMQWLIVLKSDCLSCPMNWSSLFLASLIIFKLRDGWTKFLLRGFGSRISCQKKFAGERRSSASNHRTIK